MKVARLLRKLILLNAESTPASSEIPGSSSDEHTTVNDTPVLRPADYSKIFGEDFRISDDESLDLVNASSLDVSAVKEALLHLLYACAPQVSSFSSYGVVITRHMKCSDDSCAGFIST